MGEALLPVLRLFESLCSGPPPSLAWTVRSWRRRRSRRTKVERHFWHLKGRSLVSVQVKSALCSINLNVSMGLCAGISIRWLAAPPCDRRVVLKCPATPSLQVVFGTDLRDLSCLDLCSDLLNARLQNWHLYRFSFSLSGALPAARRAGGEVFWRAPATAAIEDSLTISPSGSRGPATTLLLMFDEGGGVVGDGSHYCAKRAGWLSGSRS